MSTSEGKNPEPTHGSKGRRRRGALVGGLMVALLATLLVAWWLGRRESTDNAHLEGHVHPVAARVEGPVIEVAVGENQEVEKGDVLFRIDPALYRVNLATAVAHLADARAEAAAAQTGVPIASTTTRSALRSALASREGARTGILQARQQAEVAEAELDAALARRVQAERDLERMQRLVERDEVSQQDYDRAVAEETRARSAHAAARLEVEIAAGRMDQAAGALERAEALVAEAQTAPQQVAVHEAGASAAAARLESAEAAVEQAQLQLKWTEVRAPAAGVIGRKRVEVGQFLRPGEPVLAVVASGEIWVVANFKETQLEHLRPGQEARVKVDAYPALELSGKVESLSAATGSRFSLLPAENATGNFVKVVQRVPVRIGLDPAALSEATRGGQPLRPGMSVVVRVYTGESRTPRSVSRDAP